jgi:hypothetical protein
VCRGLTATLLQGLTFDPAKGKPDYVELREEPVQRFIVNRDEGEPSSATAPKLLAKLGRPCASASDKRVCESTLQTIHSGSGFHSRLGGSRMAPTEFVTYLVATFGDTFEIATSEGELRALLAPFDTTSDVELIAGCGRMTKTNEGWDVIKQFTDDGSCWGGTSGWKKFTVTRDGVVSLKENHTVSRPPRCFSDLGPVELPQQTPDEPPSALAAFLAPPAQRD